MERTWNSSVLELLKRDAFVMEFATYENPWFPTNDRRGYIDSYLDYSRQIFDFLGGDCFCALIAETRYRDGSGNISFRNTEQSAICRLSDGGEYVCGLNGESAFAWLEQQANGV